MNRVTTGDLQSITIEVGNELILEDPDFRAEAIREDRVIHEIDAVAGGVY